MAGSPVVVGEEISWRRVAKNRPGAPYKILSFKNGSGWVIAGSRPEPTDKKVKERLDERDMLAVSTLGQLAKHPRVAALRRFISDWYVSYLSVDDTRGVPEAGAQERLTKTGDNLANVVQYLQERYPAQLDAIFKILSHRIPQLEKVVSEPLRDGRLLLRLKDVPFADPILAKFASDGTLKMLAYLVVLHTPNPPSSLASRSPRIFSIRGSCWSSRRSAAVRPSECSFSSRRTRPSSWMGSGQRSCACFTVTIMAIPRSFEPRMFQE